MLLTMPGSVWRHPAAAKLDVVFCRWRHETEWNSVVQEIADQRTPFHESPVTSHESRLLCCARLPSSAK